MSEAKSYATAPADELGWRYEVPTSPHQKMLLLNAGGVAILGRWEGSLGQFYLAWAPLPRRDKAREAELGIG